MKVVYKKQMLELWELAGEIGTIAERDDRYAEVYRHLSNALDAAEDNKLIVNEEE